MLKIPHFIKEIIDILNKNGYEAYVVGGAVRDALLGATPTDYDITTSASPQKIIELFENTVPTGIKHGTITVIIDHIPTEVTTFRIDGNYSDNRSPDSVKFTSNISEDLSRRDFTVNALAYSNEKGIIDLFKGQEDLKNKIIRTVGNPERRFSEDALRILRAIRFSATLNFSIEEETYKAAINCAPTLNLISDERINSELSKTLLGENLSVFERFINDGGIKFLNINKTKSLKPLNTLSKNLSLRIFAFLKQSGLAVNHLNKRLKFSNALCKELEELSFINENLVSHEKSAIKKVLAKTSPSALFNYLEYLRVFKKTNTNIYEENLKNILENNEPYLISHLAINGDDLINLGFKGTEIGLILNKLLKLVIENPEYNTNENLINTLK